MNIGVIVQARSGSTRFPGKIYEDINGKTTIQRVMESVCSAAIPRKFVLAMPSYDMHSIINHFSFPTRFGTYFGDEEDVLKRYFEAAKQYELDLIVRITADSPLIQPKIIDLMLIEYMKHNYNGFMSNGKSICRFPYPSGCTVEIFPFWMLAEAHMNADNEYYREHVCTYMYRYKNPYRMYEYNNVDPNPIISMKYDDISFDTKEDLEIIKKIAVLYDQNGDLSAAIEGS